MKLPTKLKRIAIDAVGYTLILLGLLTGWIPGPGGIPLILAGLGLLSIHNHWARRLLLYFKTNGQSMLEKLFPPTKSAQLGHDIMAVLLVSSGVTLLVVQQNYVLLAFGIVCTATGVAEFLYNRDRLQAISRFFKK